MSAVLKAVCRSIRSGQGSDRCDSHQILRGLGELPVERDECVCVELGQGDVLRVKCVIPPKLAGDLPCDILEYIDMPAVRIAAETDSHPGEGDAHVYGAG
jgi:hypothetical protein